MKKIALALLVAAVALTPAATFAKKKRVKHVDPGYAAEHMDKGEASYRFMRDAMPLFLPSWSLPIYFGMRDAQKKRARSRQARPLSLGFRDPASAFARFGAFAFAEARAKAESGDGIKRNLRRLPS